MAEVQNLEKTVATNDGSTEINRTVDTGTTVAAQGASLAGVPYIGTVVSIGKTLINHGKKSAAINAKHAACCGTCICEIRERIDAHNADALLMAAE